MAIAEGERKSGNSMRRRWIVGLATLASIGAMVVAGSAQAVVTYDSSFGTPGTGKGQFSDPAGIAINKVTGDVYVVDRSNNRIQQFASDGTFIRMWGRAVNQDTNGDSCTEASGNTCKAGLAGGGAGWFSGPRGIAIDNSGGASAGSVYVQDANNQRVQKFSADGTFVLMWGKEVNQTTGGDICTAASGNTCQAGAVSGNPDTTPKILSQPGGFGNWSKNPPDNYTIATDSSGNIYVGDASAVPDARVQKFDPSGTFISQLAIPSLTDYINPSFPALTVSDANELLVINSGIEVYDLADFSADGLSGSISRYVGAGAGDSPAVDPYNGYYFTLGPPLRCDGAGGSGLAVFEYHPTGQDVDCTVPSAPAIGTFNGLSGGTAVSLSHLLYVGDTLTDKVHIFETPVAQAPTVDAQTVGEITSNKAVVTAKVAANLDQTSFHVEYGTSPCSVSACSSTDESDGIGFAIHPKQVSKQVEGLLPGTTYFYMVVVTNGEGVVTGPDLSFTTYEDSDFDPSCPNNLARQQTGAAFLLDCRAYELVSAENQGGYNVESDLIPGQTPFAGYPQASDKALYGVHNGGIPGTGKPTNRGIDPYIATRDAEHQRWNTTYVGVPADAPSSAPFSSTVAGVDESLDSFAFSGPEICDPCFADGSAGIPIRTPDGSLVQGMTGSMPVPFPQPAGGVKKHFSPDGSHFLFASEQQFEPEGNPDDGNVTIYDRNLDTDTTQVVSKLPNGDAIAAGSDVRALDISKDGSRVLIGNLSSTDAEGNEYYDLYLHEGTSPNSIELIAGGSGALFSGMTADGSQVFFTTRENLADDTDASADLFRATIANGAASIERVSKNVSGTDNFDGCDPAANSYNVDDWNTVLGGPTDCSVVAIGGGGGVAPGSGAVYFLSPEQLDGDGVDGAPNLFLALPGEDPVFVATLESSANEPLGPPAPRFKSAFGSFDDPTGVAIDSQDGSTYVLDLGGDIGGLGTVYVQKFDSAGNPDSTFAGDGILNGNDGSESFFIGVAFPGAIGPTPVPPQIAVDNSGTANAGDLYIPNLGTGEVNRYSASGAFESSINLAGDTPLGLAVDPTDGDVYIGGTFGFIYVFDSSGGFKNIIGTAGSYPVGLAVNSSGDLYEANESNTTIHLSGGGSAILDPNPSNGVAVDSATDHVFVDRGSVIAAYDAAGNPFGPPVGSSVLSASVSLDAYDGKIHVSNDGSGNVAVFEEETAPDRGFDSPLVIGSVQAAGASSTDQFQVIPSGEHAVMLTTLPLTGFDNDDKYELFRYYAGDGNLECVSCNPTGALPATDASLASRGLSITDDGRVFFETGEPLALRDTNAKLDVYEWSDGGAELISSGQSPFDSGLLTVSADGTDTFFFTREALAKNDGNGNVMKLYTARENGGFFVVPPQPQCKASDECHGPGSQAATSSSLGTLKGTGGNFKEPVRCSLRALSQGAKRLSDRAKALRHAAARASGVRAKMLRNEARRAAKKAEKRSKATKRCRSKIRRAQ